jgi:hypothetical protein
VDHTLQIFAVAYAVYSQILDEECQKLLDHRKHTKLKWLQNPCQLNGRKMLKIYVGKPKRKRLFGYA